LPRHQQTDGQRSPDSQRPSGMFLMVVATGTAVIMMVIMSAGAAMVVVLVVMIAGAGIFHIITAFQHSYEQLFIRYYMMSPLLCQ
jgi:Flp pilus assembly protein TadB